ncbi:hypothetical protein V3C41_00700 [Paenarthrobacter nicotinovorans]|uniref:Uncharacterized protein n=1 Tax=Paenarthrobacter nicotinovorans TaxID=29320 RepID=A0ABV0GM39_PAENI|nr:MULTISPECIES: hypothetical protein [Micrococcaceae]
MHSLEGDADPVRTSGPTAGVPPVPHDETVIAASPTAAILKNDRSVSITPPAK